VVDYDLRSGQVAELLGAKKTPGVTELLQGRATLDDVIQPTMYPNLFILPAGQTDPEMAGEYMCRSELKTTMDVLRKRFDYILVDTPALNLYSDAGIAGMITGEALLVVQLRKTSSEDVNNAIQTLRSTNVNIAGMLLTHRPSNFFRKIR
jgi:Mrp family chromosome partitioning ATPase